MKIIRNSVFETNSSSTHSLSIYPIDNPFDLSDETQYDSLDGLKVVNDAIVLPKNLDIEYGYMSTFREKLNYIVAILIRMNMDIVGVDGEYDTFDCYKANAMLLEKYPDFVKKITDYVSDVTGKPCNRISFVMKNGKSNHKGSITIDHGVLECADCDKDTFGLKFDLADIVITDGIWIYYEFA